MLSFTINIGSLLLSPFPYLIEYICGGYYVYNPTLKRFFLFHFIFPFLLFNFEEDINNKRKVERVYIM